MATLDSLAGDQRAVLQLVLGRGRSYDQIAGLLSISPDSVRSRALDALDALGPQTQVPDANRRLICDYLLGQLPAGEVATVRELLAGSPGERAWARVVRAEVVPLASGPLPEIPDASAPSLASALDAEPIEPVAQPVEPPIVERAEPVAEPLLEAGAPAPGGAEAADAPPTVPEVPTRADDDAGDSGPRSSRRGGMVVIGLVALIVVALVVVLALRHHHHSHLAADTPTSTTQPAPVTTSRTSTSTTSTTSASVGSAKVVTQINMHPTAAGSKAIAVGEVLQESSQRELAIVGQNIPANTTHNAYAVWLYNSPSSAYRLGFVSPGITAKGKLSAAIGLPSDAGSYKELIMTLETATDPKSPGPIVLQGTITGLS